MKFLEAITLFPIVLTLLAYQIGLLCRRKWKHPLCNPLLIAVLLVIPVLVFTGYNIKTYQAGTSILSFLITPATICLAVPLYENFRLLKGKFTAIFAGICSGTVTALISVYGLCKFFSLPPEITVSLLPKSITTAIGIALTQEANGLTALTAVAIFITGVLGSLTGTGLCKLLKIDDPAAQGVAFGTASHLIGTSKASELGSLQGAISSLSLILSGILTAILFPILLQYV